MTNIRTSKPDTHTPSQKQKLNVDSNTGTSGESEVQSTHTLKAERHTPPHTCVNERKVGDRQTESKRKNATGRGRTRE